MMKIKILFIAPPEGIGGGNRKFKIYYDNLDSRFFNKFYYYLNGDNFLIKNNVEGDTSKKISLINFIKENQIQFLYSGSDLDYKTLNEVKGFCFILKNVNFTNLYESDPKTINLIISKTDYLKIKLINKNLKNSHVIYNPIDVKSWVRISEEVKGSHRNYFRDKGVKFIIGRLARAEPSKWNFLILKTILELQKSNNFNYGFIFVGMSNLYKFFLRLFLKKKMLNNILFLNEMRELKDIGDFYKSIDLFWQTSYIGESFGNVIAESFCFKVPVLTDYKHFYKNGRIRKKLYDAQIELVDNYKNGFYANYPETVINFFELNNIDSLKTMGKSGFNKVNYEYDVRNTCNSLAKVLYSYLLKYDLCKRDNIFESLKKVPLDHEVEIFESDYLRRIYSCLNNDNKINSYNRLVYLIEEKVWNIIEFGYVIVRKILMIFNYNLEGKK